MSPLLLGATVVREGGGRWGSGARLIYRKNHSSQDEVTSSGTALWGREARSNSSTQVFPQHQGPVVCALTYHGPGAGGGGPAGGATPPPNSEAFPPQGGSSGAQLVSPEEQTGKEGSAALHPSLGRCLPLALCMKIPVPEDPLTSSQSIELLREASAGTPVLSAGRGCAKGPTQPGLFQEARARHTSRCCSALAT